MKKAQFGERAKAYQLRYLARRAVRLQGGSTAVEMIIAPY